MLALIAIAGLFVVICAKFSNTTPTIEYIQQEENNSPILNSAAKAVIQILGG